MAKRSIPLVNLKAQYQCIKKDIDKAVLETIESTQYILGSDVEKFEKGFARFCQTKYCVGVASGTEALHIALFAMNIKPGDEVIVPVNTFIATALAVSFIGANPVFVDIDPRTYNLDLNQVEVKINKKTKVIIPVHLYGQPVDINNLIKIAKKHRLLVLEDACQAHGSLYKKRSVGGFGQAAAFSFYPGKNLGAYGDGGAITTNSKRLYQKMRKIREYGSSRKYYHDELGFNSRLDTIQAAVLRVKLRKLRAWNKNRRQIARWYNQLLKPLDFIEIPFEPSHVQGNYHLYVVQVPQRDKLLEYLKKNNIFAGIHYPLPIHLQKAYKFLGYKKGDFPIAEKIANKIISLPIYPEMTKDQVKRVVDRIGKFYN